MPLALDTPSRLAPACVPSWTLVGIPVLTFLVSKVDLALLSVPVPGALGASIRFGLLTSVPACAAACGVTAWLLLRLRSSVRQAERSAGHLRRCLAQRGVDARRLHQALERQRLIHGELDHRVRNNLASLMGLVGLYEDGAANAADLARTLRGKITALRESHTLIAAGAGKGADLHELMGTLCEALLPGDRRQARARINAQGPAVRLGNRETAAMGMVVQELLTNALKHGALRPGVDGRVEVRWSLRSAGSVDAMDLYWRERPLGVTASPASEPGGLGLTLVKGIVEADLRGVLEAGPEGDEWVVHIRARLSRPVPAPVRGELIGGAA